MSTKVCQRKKDPAIRFKMRIKVDLKTGCHNWTGYKDKKGYGVFWNGKRLCRSHRYVWEQIHGKIPDGMQLHHKCTNKSCCNPDHLQLVIPKEHTLLTPNSIGYKNIKKTKCLRGHLFSGDNLVIRSDNGGRRCIKCSRELWRRNYKPHPLMPKTHCDNKHPLSGYNLIIKPSGRRICRECRNKHRRESWRRNYKPHPRVLKIHCPQGHEYLGKNLYRHTNGRRVCRKCMQESWRRNYKPHPRVPKTECTNSHPLSGENLVIDSHGQRRCKKCRNYNAKMRYMRKQALLGKEVHPNNEKTHCKHGHEYTHENTYVKKTGFRNCRTCDRERSLQRYYNKKLKIFEE